MNEPTHNTHQERALNALMDIAATVGQAYEGRDALAFKSLREMALRLDQSALRMGCVTPHPAADALAAFADELMRLGGEQQQAALDTAFGMTETAPFPHGNAGQPPAVLGTYLGFDAACCYFLEKAGVSRIHRETHGFERVVAVLTDGSLRAVKATPQGGWVGKYKAGHTLGRWTLVGACADLTTEWLSAMLTAQADVVEPTVALTPMEVYDRLAGRPGIKVVLESGGRTHMDISASGSDPVTTTLVWKEDGTTERKTGQFSTWQTADLVVTPSVVDDIVAHYDRLGGKRHG